MTNTIHLTDPMMAMIVATHARTQVALADLSDLAKQQQAANTTLTKIRKVEERLREIKADKKITHAEMNELRAEVKNLKDETGIEVNIEGLLGELNKDLHDMHDTSDRGRQLNTNETREDGDYLLINAAGSDNQQTNFENVDAIGKAFEGAKDQVRGEVSNREIDMQRMTQEVSTSMQMASNLSKRWSDVDNAIVGNLRA